jgi:hypothetical protein
MAKKDLSGAASGAADIFDTIAKGTLYTQDIQNIQDAQDMQKTEIKSKTEYYRFSYRLPLELYTYVKAAAYRASSETKTVSVTEYINNLIIADMQKGGD